jgi:RHS repeat-associated protein
MAFDGGDTTTYAYGPDYRLTSETTGSSSINYTYDGNGNLATETFGSSTVTYSFDFDNRLTGLNSPTNVATYALSWDGRRMAKTLNGSTTGYLYDGINLIAEYPDSAPAVSYLAGMALDEWVLRVEGGQKSYYTQLEDLKNVMQLTGPTGSVENAYVYRAFGELLESTESAPNVHTFTGRSRDLETSHLYFRERLYSPRTGRFLSLDPYRPDATRTARMGEPGRLLFSQTGVQDSPLFSERRDVNVTGMDVTGYIYVGNNPTNGTDPTGETILWNPASFSLSSGCLTSVCLASGCLTSKCIGSGCFESECGGSGCVGSICIGSGCGGSACYGSVCGGSGCAGSGCGSSACLKSACLGSYCYGSICLGSLCVGSGCGGSACIQTSCGVSVCGGSNCLGSICAGTKCIGSVCYASDCSGSVCKRKCCS